MARKRDGLVPIEEAISDLGGPVAAIRDASPQALHHFTRFDQVNQLVSASEADPDLGFMARLIALCSLPRTNPGNRLQYVRENGPYALVMVAGAKNKLPFGNLPRLLLAWVCTEAVRTQSRELVLGSSLSEFMRKLDVLSSDSGGTWGIRTRLRNQMDRLVSARSGSISATDAHVLSPWALRSSPPVPASARTASSRFNASGEMISFGCCGRARYFSPRILFNFFENHRFTPVSWLS